jgi:hypothetical protein
MTGTATHRSIRRSAPIVAALVVVAATQLAFTIVVDPHVRCVTTAEVNAALAAEGLAPQERCLSDATAYHLLARELAASSSYERPFDRAILGEHRSTAEYPPLFALTLSLFDRVGVDSVDAQQALFGTAIATLTALGAALLARRVGLRDVWVAMVALIVGAHPLLLQANALLMTEGMFAALVGFVLLAAMGFVHAPSTRSAATVGGLLGLAALTRGEGLIWTPIVAVVLVLATRPRAIRQAGILVVTAAAVVLPWTARNAIAFHELVPVSNNLGTVLDGANCELTYQGATIGAWRSTFSPGSDDRDQPCFEGFRIEDPEFSEAEAAARARSDGLQYALDHPGRWPAVVGARIGRTFGVFRPGQQVDLEVLEGRDHDWQWAGTVVGWALLPGAIGGLTLLARRDRAAGWVLAIPWAGVTLTTIVTYGNQRFRVGLDPTVVLLTVTALHEARRRIGRPVASPTP